MASDKRPKLRTVGPSIRAVDHRTVKLKPKAADPFYQSSEWTSLMASIIAERGRQCQECGRTNARIFGDHMIEKRDGGALLDRRNIKLLCGSCHTRKTMRARAARLRV